MPLYPDWINAENTIIWLVTFQIQISNSNFQIQNKLLCLPIFVLKLIFKTHQHFCFLCFYSRWCFFWFHKDRKITKNLFTLAENNTVKENFRALALNFICGNERGSPRRAVPLHLARSGSQSEHRIRRILPARRACHIIRIIIHLPTNTIFRGCCFKLSTAI